MGEVTALVAADGARGRVVGDTEVRRAALMVLGSAVDVEDARALLGALGIDRPVLVGIAERRSV